MLGHSHKDGSFHRLTDTGVYFGDTNIELSDLNTVSNFPSLLRNWLETSCVAFSPSRKSRKLFFHEAKNGDESTLQAVLNKKANAMNAIDISTAGVDLFHLDSFKVNKFT